MIFLQRSKQSMINDFQVAEDQTLRDSPDPLRR